MTAPRSAFGAAVDANVALRERAERAEARYAVLHILYVAEVLRADRAEAEASALYRMLPEEIRPTT